MRTIVVTGASSGIGLEAARQLAALGDQVVVVGRNPRRLGAAMARIRTAAQGPEPDEVRADFESFAEVRRLAEHLLTTYGKIDVLASNAGGMVPEHRRTPDGFEATLQGNHLGPFLLATLLRERVSRIVTTASDAHRGGTLDPADPLAGTDKKWRSWPAYGTAKQANVLFAQEAARRWPDILSVSFHPGVVRSNFGAGTLTRALWTVGAPFLKSPVQAGAELAWLAITPAEELTNGAYYVGRKATKPAARATDPELARRLWDASVDAVETGGDGTR
ncbi:SDR family NAD(P)-dependent oxidoreductase [Symbioplanes lichenis]|uniref:SDR family NAD(P)-dependent oxidoreductase n=1 Tax=Symbioplanes lichenis TaxID=1629072 RepID=UPI0027399A2A|nr:SDR family NAD(P)-dependent oxidoreductase [Actinoplanes lichenis]